jgi:hypothetical protein
MTDIPSFSIDNFQVGEYKQDLGISFRIVNMTFEDEAECTGMCTNFGNLGFGVSSVLPLMVGSFQP